MTRLRTIAKQRASDAVGALYGLFRLFLVVFALVFALTTSNAVAEAVGLLVAALLGAAEMAKRAQIRAAEERGTAAVAAAQVAAGAATAAVPTLDPVALLRDLTGGMVAPATMPGGAGVDVAPQPPAPAIPPTFPYDAGFTDGFLGRPDRRSEFASFEADHAYAVGRDSGLNQRRLFDHYEAGCDPEIRAGGPSPSIDMRFAGNPPPMPGETPAGSSPAPAIDGASQARWDAGAKARAQMGAELAARWSAGLTQEATPAPHPTGGTRPPTEGRVIGTDEAADAALLAEAETVDDIVDDDPEGFAF